MTTSVPQPATLSIATGDKINWHGQTYTITNVSAGVDNGQGTINYTVTISAGTIVVNASNCILSEPSPISGNANIWVQSADA